MRGFKILRASLCAGLLVWGCPSLAQDFQDGFDDGVLDGWESTDFHGDQGSVSVTEDTSHSEPYSAHCSGTSAAAMQRVGFTAAGGRYAAWMNIGGDHRADGSLIFQRIDGDNCYSVDCCPAGSDNPGLSITVWSQGAPSYLATTEPPFGLDTWFELAVERHADGTIAVYINGVLELSAVDTTYLDPGGFGVASWISAYVDDVSFTADVSTSVPEAPIPVVEGWGSIKALY